MDTLNGPSPAMALALAANFGSVERWHEEFVAMGKALGSGSGWVRLTFQPRDGTLTNTGAADPTNPIAGGVPILALDMRGPAHPRDIDWDAVYQRYQAAVHAASEAFAACDADVASALVLDVRRAGVFEAAEQMLPGARWCDPAAVGRWAEELPRDRDVVVYCVYGHEVGRSTAMRLRALGVKARFLDGGIDRWRSEGRPLVAKAPAGPPPARP